MIERLMQICDKITFVEVRLMEIGGSTKEFWRTISQNCLEVEWADHGTGKQVLRQEIQKFICMKFRHGVRTFTQEFTKEFTSTMRSYLFWAAEQATDQELKNFWTTQAEEIVPYIKIQFSEMETAVMEF